MLHVANAIGLPLCHAHSEDVAEYDIWAWKTGCCKKCGKILRDRRSELVIRGLEDRAAKSNNIIMLKGQRGYKST